MSITMLKPTKLCSFPPELLLNIFELAADSYDPQREPSIDVGNQSPWTKDLRVRKAIVRVCRIWREVALEGIYHRVYLHRVGQLCALVKMLEEKVGYRAWVRHIHGSLFVQQNWEKIYVRSVVKLLTLCPSCKSLSWRIAWDGDFNAPSSALSSLIGILCVGNLAKSTFLSSGTLCSLQKLKISLDFISFAIPDKKLSWALLPNLEDLTCEARQPFILSTLDIILHKIGMPNLQRLTIIVPRTTSKSVLSEKQVASICSSLERHGSSLSFFALDILAITENIGIGLGEIVNLAPNLVSLRFPAIALSASALSSAFESLREIELYAFDQFEVETPETYNPGNLTHFLDLAANRSKFPILQCLILCDQVNFSAPFDGLIESSCRDSAFQYFLSWTKKFRELGITLLQVDRKPLISIDQERWNGWTANGKDNGEPIVEDEFTELSDSSYIYESAESDLDFSSDSDSVATIHSIRSIEALEIFESTVEDEFADLESHGSEDSDGV
ncbi:hypothetical protein SCHPADRAFT_1001811 [Schizopora paradoxa]|uniref:Uncharacterized protein n=1 Tax=Schizopora paradoxa TaxID=27342 RepID=A0A0H2R613_9AGAM|nr:hypothetical protein SCHPADRAFT_1001811 [Schizopora paradoxa]